MRKSAPGGDQSLFKGYIFSLTYFLLFLAEFSCYFLTYSEAIVADGYYNLFISGLWMIKICNKVSLIAYYRFHVKLIYSNSQVNF